VHRLQSLPLTGSGLAGVLQTWKGVVWFAPFFAAIVTEPKVDDINAW
jgi:hypothetical protein